MRTGIFETNSSSTHSIAICTEDDYKAFKKGKKLIDRNSLKLYDSVEEGMAKDKWAEEEDFMTYEEFEEKFTTPSGDKVVAFGYYGYDC